MLCHIFQYLQAEGTVNVTFVLRQVLPLSYEHTHRHTLCLSRYQKSTPCVSVTPGFCFLHGPRWQRGFPFSGTHVERWYVWILNRTPQRIPNWEHGVVVVGGRIIFTFYFARRYLWHTSPTAENIKAVLIWSQRGGKNILISMAGCQSATERSI